MKKMTFQRAKALNLAFIPEDDQFDLNEVIELFHERLNENQPVKEFINTYLGDHEHIEYLLADNFETITMHDVKEDLTIVTPEKLTVWTNKRILIYRNIKNKAYYRSKNQIPGLERGFHLFDSCMMVRYDKLEHIYVEKDSLNMFITSCNINEKSERLKINVDLYDFCFDRITKIFGNYM